MRIGIYGLGRFGSFWAGLCTRLGTVIAYNRSPRPLPSLVQQVDLAELCGADAIFLCCAISAIPEVCTQMRPYLRPGTLVMDTCSVKVWPLSQMKAIFPEEVDIIGTHPMFGPDSAREGIVGLPIVLSELRSSQTRFQYWKQLMDGLGLRTLTMSPDEHDREAARTQGITHLIGRALSELGLSSSPMATLGYRKLAEIMEQTCNDPWQLFVDLQRYNPYSGAMRSEFMGALDEIEKKLSSPD